MRTTEEAKKLANAQATMLIEGAGIVGGECFNKDQMISMLAAAWILGELSGRHEGLREAEELWKKN